MTSLQKCINCKIKNKYPSHDFCGKTCARLFNNPQEKLSLTSSNNSLKVMTYNICWEALFGFEPNMYQCDAGLAKNPAWDRINNCTYNSLRIIREESVNNLGDLPDFIAIQEINEDRWNRLVNLSDHNFRGFIGNYNKSCTNFVRTGVITLYKKNRFNIINTLRGPLYGNRPFNISEFIDMTTKEHFIFINVHFDHSIGNNFDILLQNLQILKGNANIINYKIIIAGDFNHKVEDMPQLFTLLKRLDQKIPNFVIPPTIQPTCCDMNRGLYYTFRSDNIMYNFNSNVKYSTIDPNKYKLPSGLISMSDHLPVFANLTLQPTVMNIVPVKIFVLGSDDKKETKQTEKFCYKKNKDLVYYNDRNQEKIKKAYDKKVSTQVIINDIMGSKIHKIRFTDKITILKPNEYKLLLELEK
jgi:endonuclease/exonuclease/phosphatase family metal-dependent hydrolase